MNASMVRSWISSRWKYAILAGVMVAGATVVVFAYGSRGERELSDRERIVATVNGTPISVKRFNESYVNYLITTGANDTEGNRYGHLNNLIDTYLLAEEAKRRGLDEEEAYRNFYERKLKHTVGGQYYYEVFLDTLSPLDESEIRQAFARSKEKVVVRHLLFSDPREAQRSYERLQAGEDFVQLANEVYQTEAFDSSAGFLGVAGYWDLDDAFAEAAFTAPVGVPTEPVRTAYGYHIILKEDHLYNPLLTEDEFTYRREGVSQRAHQRKMRLEGDHFVRDFMMSLDVEVDREAVVALREAIERITVRTHEYTQQPPARLSMEEVGSLMESFTPETPLVTYTLDGEERTFTALDYYRWLPELSFQEARTRTAASVGRALRNEVLALKGFEENLDDHEVVTEYMQFASSAFLAAALRNYLRENARAEPTAEEIEKAYRTLGYRTIKRAVADFWTIECASYEHAEQVKKEIESGADAASFDGYTYYDDQDLHPLKALGAHVRRSILQRPVVLGTEGENWYVLYVDEREIEWTSLDEKEPEIRELLSTRMPEARLAGDLRTTAEVDIDSALFEEMMDF